MAPRFDLQSHSTHSDGELAAEEVVRRAADAGVELLALTDHDTVSGVSEALVAGERAGIRVVPAVEISSVDDGAPERLKSLPVRFSRPVFPGETIRTEFFGAGSEVFGGRHRERVN